MIFVPSFDGVSHNPAEHTDPADIEAGANLLADVVWRLADGDIHDALAPGRADEPPPDQPPPDQPPPTALPPQSHPPKGASA